MKKAVISGITGQKKACRAALLLGAICQFKSPPRSYQTSAKQVFGELQAFPQPVTTPLYPRNLRAVSRSGFNRG